jgi:membrane-bound ClpP family serine protease
MLPDVCGAPTVGRVFSGHNVPTSETGDTMIILGVILLIIGLVAGIGILTTIGIILIVIGLILALLGMVGRPVGGRRFYY